MNYLFLIFLIIIIVLCSVTTVKDNFDDNYEDRCPPDPATCDDELDQLDEEGGCEVRNNTDYYGYTFLSKSAKDHKECCKLCLQHPKKCNCWSFDEQKKVCELKYNRPEASECSNVTSGFPKVATVMPVAEEGKPPVAEEEAPPEPKRLGCHKDDPRRFLKGLPSPHYVEFSDLTPSKCFKYCRERNFRYAGLQAGHACLCDNSPEQGFGEKVLDTECQNPCKGDAGKKCGAIWRNDIYDLQPDKPEPKPPVKSETVSAKRLGCYADDGTRHLKGLPFPHYVNMDDMTQEKCFDLCRSKNFRYAGLQDGHGCLCDNLPSRGFGEKKPDAECVKPCKGESTKTCGNPWRQEIYDLKPNEPQEEAKAPTEQKLGCYKDDPTRFLQGLPSPHYHQAADMTPEKCFAHCRQKGFRYAGLQDGHACLCDNEPTRGFGEKRPDNECSKTCAGDKSKTCGNFWLQDIYDLQPGKPKQPPKPKIVPVNIAFSFDCTTSKFMPNALKNTNRFTLFLKINMTRNVQGWAHILHGGDAQAWRRTPGIFTHDGNLHIRASSKGNWNDGDNCYTLQPKLELNKVYDLITVYNATEIVVYLDRKLIATCPTKGEIVPETDLYLGKSPPYQGLPAIITVDYVDQALNAEQLKEMARIV